ncbi:MAG: helix-turn-helix transcriptional regulator [Eubacteriaceae bacterium]
MGNSKLKLLRIIDILSDTDEDHPLTANQICDKLMNCYDIKAERKSICRDINLLIDDGHYDILLSSDNKRGYFMASRTFEDWELKILIDAVWGSKFLTENSADEVSEKLYNQANQWSRRMLKSATPVKLRIKSKNKGTRENIEMILKAIKADRKVIFQYCYTDPELNTQLRKNGALYTVNPYALIWQNEQYYLLCSYADYNNLSYYRLDRMKNVVISGEQRRSQKESLGDNADMVIEKFVRSALHQYSGEKTKVTLEADQTMVDELLDYFGSDIHFDSNGSRVQTTVDVIDSDGLYYWLLQHGTNIKVIRPESVRTQLVNRVNAIQALYAEPSPVFETAEYSLSEDPEPGLSENPDQNTAGE